MDLRHLRSFVAVAEERHFGRAAARLHIAQPPLSRQIQALEGELGLLLIDRSRRRIELTAAGETFLRHARRVFDALELAVAETRRANVGETGRIVVAYPSSLASSGIAELLRAYRARFPDVAITLRELPPAEQIEALKNGDADVGFVRAPLDDAAIASECVRDEPLVLALPSDHPLASEGGRGKKAGAIRLAALAREPFVSFPRLRGPSLFDHIIALCHRAGFSPRIVQEAPQLDLLSLVAAGFGVAIVPASVQLLRRTGVVIRPIVGNPRTSLLLAWRAGESSPVVRELLAFVRKVGVGEAGTGRAK